ncbi:unnamed protein product [Penicillium salamii]|nr:unnamed protein product [Penicillium salamii]
MLIHCIIGNSYNTLSPMSSSLARLCLRRRRCLIFALSSCLCSFVFVVFVVFACYSMLYSLLCLVLSCCLCLFVFAYLSLLICLCLFVFAYLSLLSCLCSLVFALLSLLSRVRLQHVRLQLLQLLQRLRLQRLCLLVFVCVLFVLVSTIFAFNVFVFVFNAFNVFACSSVSVSSSSWSPPSSSSTPSSSTSLLARLCLCPLRLRFVFFVSLIFAYSLLLYRLRLCSLVFAWSLFCLCSLSFSVLLSLLACLCSLVPTPYPLTPSTLSQLPTRRETVSSTRVSAVRASQGGCSSKRRFDIGAHSDRRPEAVCPCGSNLLLHRLRPFSTPRPTATPSWTLHLVQASTLPTCPFARTSSSLALHYFVFVREPETDRDL